MLDKTSQFCFITWKNIETKPKLILRRWQPSMFMPRRLRLVCVMAKYRFWTAFSNWKEHDEILAQEHYKCTSNCVLSRWKYVDFWNSNVLSSCYCMIKAQAAVAGIYLSSWKAKGFEFYFFNCGVEEMKRSLCFSLYISFKITSIIPCNLNTTLWTAGERITVLFNLGMLPF